MILHDYHRSSSAFRVRIGLNLKGLPYSIRVHSLDEQEHRSSAYLKINPHGLLPALEDGDQKIFQSGAILEYLDEKIVLPMLLPNDLPGKARVRGLFYHVACDIHPLTTRRVTGYLQQRIATPEEPQAWKHAWMMEGLSSLEVALSSHPSTGVFCHGDNPSLADVALVPQVVSALTQGVMLDDLPTVLRIYERCMALPAFRDAHPDYCSSNPDRAED